MFRNLSIGAIGISANLQEALRLAKLGNFQGVEISVSEIVELAKERSSMDAVKELFQRADILPGGWGLPVNIYSNETEYQEALKNLPKLAKAGYELGCTRAITWIPPASDERDFQANFEFHIQRLRPVAEILKDNGCRLGLEFIGPKTSRVAKRYEFIWNMAGMLELCSAIGTDNVGLMVDSWHWYTSYGSVDELLRLENRQVVYVHINDAPAGIPVDEQIDNIRKLPGETGVIDLVGFLGALSQIGYDGPVTPEPFSEEVNKLPPEDAVRVTGEALLGVWRKAGLI